MTESVEPRIAAVAAVLKKCFGPHATDDFEAVAEKCLRAADQEAEHGSAPARDEERPGLIAARIAGESPAAPAMHQILQHVYDYCVGRELNDGKYIERAIYTALSRLRETAPTTDQLEDCRATFEARFGKGGHDISRGKTAYGDDFYTNRETEMLWIAFKNGWKDRTPKREIVDEASVAGVVDRALASTWHSDSDTRPHAKARRTKAGRVARALLGRFEIRRRG